MSTINLVAEQTVTTTLEDTDIFLVPDTDGTPFYGTVHDVRNELINKLVDLTAATLTVTAALHAGKTITINRAAGTTITLPAATGTGNRYRFVVGTTLTGDGIIQVANATDIIQGALALSTDIAGVTISAGTSDDTITMNGTTKGGLIGSFIEIVDIAAGVFVCTGALVSSGTEADPFSAAVS